MLYSVQVQLGTNEKYWPCAKYLLHKLSKIKDDFSES